ncbi:hypothetical protein [Flavobacterium sp.]|uniref:hypothetical protein n=1 Tax=Flavobacterium sp. TaxID=239 RepID=UPI0026295A9A|nr:hypothetical protein [Flavobacterium sp.]
MADSNLIPLRFDPKLFVCLTLGFIAATVIGTVSHECGHYIACRLMGFDAVVHYGMTTHHGPRMPRTARLVFLLGGPLQTMLTGSIGVILLYLFRKDFYRAEKLNWRQWLMVFTALFWLRQFSNSVMLVIRYLDSGEFSSRGDEFRLAAYLEWPKWTILFSTGAIGCSVLLWVILSFIPRDYRLTFMISGIVGGVTGFILWLDIFGKVILP